jgi:hypothetical protein
VKQFSIVINQCIVPPDSLLSFDRIKKAAAHGPPKVVSYRTTTWINTHQGAADFFVQMPIGRKAIESLYQHPLTLTLLHQAKIFLQQTLHSQKRYRAFQLHAETAWPSQIV